MSVDTRTPHGPSLNEPVLNMVKVPCDPAQVVVNHASFRVVLPPSSPHAWGHRPGPQVLGDTGRGADALASLLPRIPAAARRRRPLVWSGRSTPGDPGASTLLQAVRTAGVADRLADSGITATQVLPRVRPAEPDPHGGYHDLGAAVIGPRSPAPEESTEPPVMVGEPTDSDRPGGARSGRRGHARGRGQGGRQAFYPGRRMSLGVVLLPLRVLLGFISLYAGMGKLTDPVYFDGGERGSLSSWLHGLEPWSAAAPLHDWALAHPVGAGLSVAFTQLVVGVLTVFGLWQRLAAALGAALSLALLVTVSWQHGPAYDTPDVILLAAWSPLLIAGAPVYSLDARLAGEAWRTLGPRAPLSELRRRVLRRGSALSALLLGSALLIGSMLGSAVRSSQLPQLPEPGEPPVNHLPGEQLPEDEARDESTGSPSADPAQDAEQRAKEGGATAGEETSRPESDTAVTDEGVPVVGGTGGSGDESYQQTPTTEQTVPAPRQSAPEAEEYTPQEETAPPADLGTGESAPEESAPTDEGDDGGSLGTIGGLLD
ncbi:DoxX family membrane protein [Streptomyces sp. B6B3]|uniref:DoxX family membrane protein n=1 Tax=Streptomyces sp. B6B3 TaxID=3153570 RepID=UPI00325C68BC